MTDDELRNFVIEFRRGLLDGRASTQHCFMLCAPLSTLLTIHGVPNTLVETWLKRPPRNHGRIQAVVATSIVFIHNSSASSASAGVLQPSVFLGRALRAAATAAISSALWTLRSVPLGKYWRSSPLVFSLVPRCHGLCGSQK